MQCTAKNNIAHCFINRLQEGCVYFIGNFTVQANKDEFRILNDNNLMIELQGSTYVRKDATDVGGFVRYPFTCFEFENLEPTDRKYFVDVIGYVLNVGKPTLQKTGATTLDFDLANQSDMEFTEDTEHRSTTAHLGSSREGTLAQLLQLARKGKNDVVTFRCKLQITNIRTKNGWYYFTCNICKCKKGVSRQAGNFWCQSCEKLVSFSRTRFRLQNDVRDDSSETVTVLFDETAEKLVNATAQALLDDSNQDSCTSVLPNALANLINTTHTFELKRNTYYDHASYESFNCIKVYTTEPTIEDASANKLQQLDQPIVEGSFSNATKAKHSSPKAQKRDPTVTTPAKRFERKKRRKCIIQSSDSEDESRKDESRKDSEDESSNDSDDKLEKEEKDKLIAGY